MSEPTILVRNRTGVTQVMANDGITLEPGHWHAVPRRLAYRMLKLQMVDIALPDTKGLYVFREQDGVHFFWTSPFSIGDGYATAAENMVNALVRIGAHPSVHQCWFADKKGLLPSTIDLLVQGDTDDRLFLVGVCMATPGEFVKLPTPYKIGITMYESTTPLELHPEWRHQCNAVDRLFLPAQWTAEVFRRFVTIPIDIVPLAVNPAYCNPVLHRPKEDGSFTFISHGTLTARKSPIETIGLFKKVFPKHKYPHVRLKLKTRLGILGLGEHQLPALDDDRIEVIDANFMLDEMRAFVDDADCMLYLSKGEGFGLPPRETMAAGLPTILANNTGMIEVCDSRYNWPIPTLKTEKADLGGEWYVPNWDYAADVMHWVVDHKEEAFAKAYRGGLWFVETQGPDAAARQLVAALKRISDPYEYAMARLTQTLTAQRVVPSIEEAHWLHEHHKPLYDEIEQWVPKPGPLVEVGADSCVPLAGAVLAGYDGVGVVYDRDGVERARSMLAEFSFGNAVFYADPFTHSLASTVPGKAACCFSQGTFAYYTRDEVRRLVDSQLRVAPLVIFSVPSVYHPQIAREGERLLTKEQWMEILDPFDVEQASYYGGGSGSWHVLFVVSGHATRGSLVRRAPPVVGRVTEGVWHPRKMPE